MNKIIAKKRRQAGSILLIGSLALSIAAGGANTQAAQSGSSELTSATSILFIDDKEPSEYDVNDTSNPYGLEAGEVFNINPVSELYTYVSYDGNDSSKAYNSATISDKVSLNWRTLNIGSSSTISNSNGKNWAHAVSYDSDGDGRNESVATVYWAKDSGVYVEITNTVTKATTKNRILRHNYSRLYGSIGDSTDYYEGLNFFDITSGDYDGDGKDELVVFDGQDIRIYENGVKPSDSNTAGTCGYSNNYNVINPAYYNAKKSNGDRIADTTKKVGDDGRNLLFVRLASGDVNDDGIDDLVVMSYCDKTEDWDSNTISASLYAPYLSVCLGAKNGTATMFSKGASSATNVWEACPGENGTLFDTVISAGVAVGDVNGDGKNNIIVAGKSVSLKDVKAKDEDGNTSNGADGLCDGWTTSNNISIAKYTYTDNGLDGTLANGAATQLKADKITDNGIHTSKDNVWSPVSVATVATKGYGTAEDIFVNGNLYSWADDALPKVVFDYYNDSDTMNMEDGSRQLVLLQLQ